MSRLRIYRQNKGAPSSDAGVLKFAIENGMIDKTLIEKKIEMQGKNSK